MHRLAPRGESRCARLPRQTDYEAIANRVAATGMHRDNGDLKLVLPPEDFDMSSARQDRFLGVLMGMGIGDALGMPVAELDSTEIVKRFGSIDRYHARSLPDGAELSAGEFTDESELALCIVESLTVNDGVVEVDNIGARFLLLAKGEAKRWIAPDTLAALARADSELEFVASLDEDGPATGDVAARGIPVGLLHSVGTLDEGALRRDAEAVTRITHGSPAAIASVIAVAYLVQSAARGLAPSTWASTTAAFLGGGATADVLARLSDGECGNPLSDDAADVVASAVVIASRSQDFETAVMDAVNLGGPADARGAITGALAGARWGIAGIPQSLIDGLEGRIYVSLAAPWFYRTALRRAGLVIDLKSQR